LPALTFEYIEKKVEVEDSEPLSIRDTAVGSNPDSERDTDSCIESSRPSIASEHHSDQILFNESASNRDPKLDNQSRDCVGIQPKDYTTVMLRNLPNNYSRDMLIDLLEASGCQERFDFVYVPTDFQKCAGLGYAFVNFLTNGDAARAMTVLESFSDWKVPSQKVLHLSWSLPLQGLAANIERYRNSAVMHPDVPQHFKPLVFEHGQPISFPAPTRNITLSIRSTVVESLGAAQPSQPRTRTQDEKPKPSPRRKQQQFSGYPEVAPGEYTTVMLRNLPNDYTRDMLVELLELKGFHRCFDFVYVPMDFEKGSGLGYAFVNFVKHNDAQHAMNILDNFDDWKVPSRKVLLLSWSTPLQGLAANIERYRNTSVMHPAVPDHFKPAVFNRGCLTSFPPPSRNIHPPNRRK
jgi:RNA recognition motif-containing protein